MTMTTAPMTAFYYSVVVVRREFCERINAGKRTNVVRCRSIPYTIASIFWIVVPMQTTPPPTQRTDETRWCAKHPKKRIRQKRLKRNTSQGRHEANFRVANWKTLITLLLNTMFGNLLRHSCACTTRTMEMIVCVSRLHSVPRLDSRLPAKSSSNGKWQRRKRGKWVEKLENFRNEYSNIFRLIRWKCGQTGDFTIGCRWEKNGE